MNNYSLEVLKYFDDPCHAGVLDDASSVYVAKYGLLDNQEVLELSVQVERGVIVLAKFRVYGTPVLIAIGQWLCDRIIGTSISYCINHQLKAPDVLSALSLPKTKQHLAQAAVVVLAEVCTASC